MTTPLQPSDSSDCWNHIGVWGDHSCPELQNVTHCHNCPVFAKAGRRFLDAPSPPDYIEEWTTRLAQAVVKPIDEGLRGVLFRLQQEWFALPVTAMVEVSPWKPVRRVPHRGGLLAGLVNIRGELLLVFRMEPLVGLVTTDTSESRFTRHLVIRDNTETWAFAVEEVDKVLHIPSSSINTLPPTLSRAEAHLTRGTIHLENRTYGLIDTDQLFQTLRERVR